MPLNKITLNDGRKNPINTLFSFHLEENEKISDLEKKKYGLALQIALKAPSSDAVFKKLYPVKNVENKYTLVFELDGILQVHPNIEIPHSELEKIKVTTGKSQMPLQESELGIIDTLTNKEFYALPFKGLHVNVVYSRLAQSEAEDKDKTKKLFSHFAKILTSLDDGANISLKATSLESKIVSNNAQIQSLSESLTLDAETAALRTHRLWTQQVERTKAQIERIHNDNKALAEQIAAFRDLKTHAHDNRTQHVEHRCSYLNSVKAEVMTVLQNSALEYWVKLLYANSGTITPDIITQFNSKFSGIAEVMPEYKHLPLRIFFLPLAANKSLAEIKKCIDDSLKLNPKPNFYSPYYLVSVATGYAPTCTLRENICALAAQTTTPFNINDQDQFEWSEAIIALDDAPEYHTKELEKDIDQLAKNLDASLQAPGAATEAPQHQQEITATKAALAQMLKNKSDVAQEVEDANTSSTHIYQSFLEIQTKINTQINSNTLPGISFAELKTQLAQLQLACNGVSSCVASINRQYADITVVKTLASSNTALKNTRSLLAMHKTKIENFHTQYKALLQEQEKVNIQQQQTTSRLEEENRESNFISQFLNIRNALVNNKDFWHAQTRSFLCFGGTIPEGHDQTVPRGIAEMMNDLAESPDQAITYEYARQTMRTLKSIAATANQRPSSKGCFQARMTPTQSMYDLIDKHFDLEKPDTAKIEKHLNAINKNWARKPTVARSISIPVSGKGEAKQALLRR